jgi:hypothetical protein
MSRGILSDRSLFTASILLIECDFGEDCESDQEQSSKNVYVYHASILLPFEKYTIFT